MSKLIDIFVDWAKEQHRWPLLVLLVLPAIIKFSQEYFQLSLRAAFAHWSVLITSGDLLIVLGGLYYLVGAPDSMNGLG